MSWRKLLVFLAVASLAAAAGIFAAGSSAHNDPCHRSHSCPSDHHSYLWNGLSCTSYAGERLSSDTKTVVYEGRTYWCGGSGSAPASGGSSAGGESGDTGCGVERWQVKTLKDAGARLINFAPRAATIRYLRTLRPPAHLPPTRLKAERVVYRVSGRLEAAKIEEDSDVHLVLSDPKSGGTMIVEMPSFSCTGGAAPQARQKMRSARGAFLKACGYISHSRFTPLSGTATVTGVLFFDFIHGQRGVAPNGIELHPLLSFSGSCRSG